MLSLEGLKLLNMFFEKRFKRKPDPKDAYYQEWKKRFETGSPYTYMDGISRKVYLDVLKKRINALGGLV